MTVGFSAQHLVTSVTLIPVVGSHELSFTAVVVVGKSDV